MKKMPKFIWILAVVFVMGVSMASCAGAQDGGGYASGSWSYKMTVEIETPEGIKTGSAVRKVSVIRSGILTSQMLPTVKLKGEAVVVDLGARGVVFALLKGYKVGADYGADIPAYMFNPERAYMSSKGIAHMSQLKGESKVLDPEWYPQFVWFRDINDPKTVENLLEMESDGRSSPTFTIKKDHFAEAFGAGVKLREVTIEMTDEPVTWGVVEKYMPSYRPIEDYMKWINTLKYSDPRRIGPDLFRKGN